MSDIVELATVIANQWARECALAEEVILQGDPLLRSNLEEEAQRVERERRERHDEISRLTPTDAKETLILALFAADYFAQADAGRTDRNVPLRHLHNSVVAGLEEVAGITRKELALDFLWISPHDGPGIS